MFPAALQGIRPGGCPSGLVHDQVYLPTLLGLPDPVWLSHAHPGELPHQAVYVLQQNGLQRVSAGLFLTMGCNSLEYIRDNLNTRE